jgi:hypothetical protein
MRKKMKRSKRKKEISPNLFVSSILFIVCMVIVSVVVGALAEPQVNSISPIEELTVLGVTFSGGGTIELVVSNSGTLSIVLAEVWVNNEKQYFEVNPSSGKIFPNENMEISVNQAYANGSNYQIKIVSERSNVYLVSATALI